MRRVVTVVAVLLLAAPASAWPILPPHCRCVELPQEPGPNTDPGWDPALTLAEIQELQRLDDLHEPPFAKPEHVLVCDALQVPMGGSGSSGGGNVPEPGLFGLLALAGVAGAVRRAARRTIRN